MDDNFTDLQKLLRLKRHEAPPPEYFENFLKDFQARQRQEIIKVPLWRIAWDRLTGSFAPFEMPRLAYGTACAVALFAAAITSKQILTTTPATSPIAKIEAVILPKEATTPAGFSLPLNRSRLVARAVPGSQPVFFTAAEYPGFEVARDRMRAEAQITGAPARTPRYVLDSRPVSYAAPASF